MNKSTMNTSTGAMPSGGKDAVVEQAKHTASKVGEQVTHQLDTRKDRAVETMSSVANVIRDSGKLKGGTFGDVAERTASGIERAAQFFEQKQISDIVRDVESYARREPALFLGAAFTIGLIGGRFLKSSATRLEQPFPGGGVKPGWSDRDDMLYGSSYGAGDSGSASGYDLPEEDFGTPGTGMGSPGYGTPGTGTSGMGSSGIGRSGTSASGPGSSGMGGTGISGGPPSSSTSGTPGSSIASGATTADDGGPQGIR